MDSTAASPLIWVGMIVLVLSPLILYLLALLGMGLKNKYLPARCPRCGKRGLELVNFFRVRGGPRCWYSLHRCPACAAKLRRDDDGWHDLPAEEWTRMNLP